MDNTEVISPCPSSSGHEFQSIWLSLLQAGEAERAAVEEADRDYRPTIATPELIVEIRRLLATERRAERLVCRYLADMADRLWAGQHGELNCYDDEYHAARCFFGLSERETRERIRIGRALRRLPRVEQAFMTGEVSYSRVREVSRVAQTDNESDWLHLARTLDMRALERRVAETRKSVMRPFHPDAPADAPRSAPAVARPAASERNAVRVTFDLTSEAWEHVRRALDATRAGSARPLTDSEALETLARNAVRSQQVEHAVSARSGLAAAKLAAANPAAANLAAEGRGAATARATSIRNAAPAGGVVKLHDGTLEPRSAQGARHGAAQVTKQNDTTATTTTTRTRAADAHIQHARDVNDNGHDDVPANKPSQAVADLLRRLSEPDDTSGSTQGWAGTEHMDHLIQVMGRRRRWTANELIYASGLTAAQVSYTLTFLELGRHVRRDGAFFDPT